jgi:transcriptional regulator NrdR family protein
MEPTCPHCGSKDSIVIKTWRGGQLKRRRRRCSQCDETFATAQSAEFLCDKRGFAISGINLYCRVRKCA